MPPRILLGVGGSVALLGGVWLWLALPPPSIELAVDPSALAGGVTIRGAFHVHTTRSDGAGPPREVAEAASRAGLQFVVLTDHGNGTTFHLPEYHAGVLLVTGVGISTDAGHYIAVGMSRAPYPLGGDPEGVIADVRRLGGFGLVAHPTSPNAGLAWTEPDLEGIDGIEWLNADSAWRDEGLPRLGLAATAYPFRPSETVGSFLDRPSQALELWEKMTTRRRVVGVAGADAHAGIIGYEALFRSFSINLALSEPMQGDAILDADRVVQALRRGHVFTAIDSLAHPASLRFEATTATTGVRFRMGDSVPGDLDVEITASANAPPGSTLVLLADGLAVTETTGQEIQYQAPRARSAFRLEVRLPESSPGSPPIPWIVTNPIYYGIDEAVPATRAPSRVIVRRRRLLAADETRGGERSVDPWRVEHDDSSHSAATRDEESLSWSFRVGDASEDRQSPYAALVRGIPSRLVTDFDAITFDAVADRPARVSFQLRAGTVSGQPRWRTSFYVDDVARRVVIPFDRLRPIADAPETIDPAVDSLLLVSDLVNFDPGNEATVRIARPRLERWAEPTGGGAGTP